MKKLFLLLVFLFFSWPVLTIGQSTSIISFKNQVKFKWGGPADEFFVATLVNENLSAGSYSYNFDASNLTSGVYLYKLQAGKHSETKKMILIK